jgi:hypothetical protein
MSWTVDLLDPAAVEEMNAQPADIRAKFLRLVDMVEAHGPQALREPHAKHLQGKL